jgi:hypothetical protein
MMYISKHKVGENRLIMLQQDGTEIADAQRAVLYELKMVK